MMLPVPFSSMGRAKTWLARIAPVRLVSRMAAHSSSGTSRLGVRLVRPAAFKRMSTLPNACRTASRSFSRDARSVTSEGTRRLRRPLASTALAVSSTTSARREVATTSAPASARPMAMARPRPEVPPRTTATLPARSRAASPTCALLKVVYGMPTLAENRSRFRWVVCALIFLATTVNYIDRQVLGILAPVLQKEIGWNEIEYGYIVMAFQAAYAIGLVLSGGLLDRFGTKLGYAVALVFWSLAAMAHAFARTPFGFGTARFALGLGEAANFPAAIKSVAEWFPKRERAFATGLFNSGTNIGAIVAPLVVPPLAAAYGWPSAFIVTGAIGLLWLVLWLPLYGPPETHPRVSPSELALIRSDPPEATVKVPWLSLLPYRQTWAFALGKFLTDPIWWFYLYWIPKFLNERHGITLTQMGPPLVAIYLIADVGSIGGGWLSSRLIKSGWSVNAARKRHDAALRAPRHPHRVRHPGEGRLVGGGHRRPGRGRPPGLLGQHLHPGLRHVPEAGGGLGGGHRRHGGSGGRDVHRHPRRLRAAVDGQLLRALRHRRRSLPRGHGRHPGSWPPASSPPRTSRLLPPERRRHDLFRRRRPTSVRPRRPRQKSRPPHAAAPSPAARAGQDPPGVAEAAPGAGAARAHAPPRRRPCGS